MRKRIICLIVAIVMCCSAFAGCNLVTFDQERDNNKVVISVASYEIKSPDGQKTYKTEAKSIKATSKRFITIMRTPIRSITVTLRIR